MKFYFLMFLFLMAGKVALGTPLAGTYTIGGTAPNYATFNLAVTALVNNGVNGPVVFNVASGTYTEQVTISAISGASSSNLITFRSATGNAGDVTLTYAPGSSNNWVVGLNGASYIVFKYLTIQSTGSAYTTVINIYNAASYDTVQNSILTAPFANSNSSDNAVVNLAGDISLCNYIGLSGNVLNNGSFGLYSYFHSPDHFINGLNISGNSFFDQYAGAIYNYRVLSAKIKNNYITTNVANSSYNGIKIYNGQDTVCNNQIYNCPGAGINFEGCSPYMFNNMIEITGSAVNYGINLNWDNFCGDTVYVSGNTVLVLNTNNQSAALYFPYPYSYVDYPFDYIRDNAFINRGGGYAINLQDTIAVSQSRFNRQHVMDYNDYYTSGTYIGKWGTKNATTLLNWQTTINSCACGADAHSLNVNPGFVSDTDLHITVDNLRGGIPTSDAGAKDIDGEVRNGSVTDIGADELTHPVHTAKFMANHSNICAGDSVTFTDQTSNAPSNWTWSFTGGNIPVSQKQNPVVIYNVAGIFDVELVVTTNGGPDTLLKSGYITVNPGAIAGTVRATPDTVCSNNTVQLNTKGASGNLQWQWSCTNGNFQNILNATDSAYTTAPITAPFYFRVVVVNGTCSDSSAGRLVAVNPLPVPVISTADSLICSSDSTSIILNQNFNAYAWSNDDIGNSIYAHQAGGYWVTVTDANNCTAESNHQYITGLPIPSVSTGVHGDTLTSLSANSYQWFLNGDSIPGAHLPVYVAEQTGDYTVQVIDSNGCSATSEKTHINITGLASLTNNYNIDIYPDPFTDILYIKTDAGSALIKSIEIYDVAGRKVWATTFKRLLDNIYSLNAAELPEGVYYLKLRTSEDEYCKKMFKQ